MKASDVIGKRIVKVHQSVQERGGTRSKANVVEALELEDGTMLSPVTIETETGEYMHEFRVTKGRQKSGV